MIDSPLACDKGFLVTGELETVLSMMQDRSKHQQTSIVFAFLTVAV